MAPAADPRRRRPTDGQIRIIECLSHGLGYKGTAEVLVLSPYTVKGQVRDAKRRAAAKDQAHLIGICLREGWIQ